MSAAAEPLLSSDPPATFGSPSHFRNQSVTTSSSWQALDPLHENVRDVTRQIVHRLGRNAQPDLHGIGGDRVPVKSGVDSLAGDPGDRFSMVLTNPPFGKKIFFDARPAREKPWTERLWVYDLRTNKHFTLKMKPLRRAELDDFVACYRPGERHKRQPTWSPENDGGRWKAFEYNELAKRDKLNLDLLWLRDSALEDSENLPEPEVLAAQIVEDLEAALEAFRGVAAELEVSGDTT